MKIAILGNMNNNGFALMRYFRDLGADAHLLLYKNDGEKTLEHFKPENDTFNIEKWCHFIHQTEILNDPLHVLPEQVQKLPLLFYKIRDKVNARSLHYTSLSNKEIINTFEPYKAIVSSGYGPALLHRANRIATVFSPYSSGVEGIYRMYAPSAARFPNRLIFEYARYLQIKALKLSQHIVTAELGLTSDQLKKNGLIFKKLAMPMVYLEENIPDSLVQKNIYEIGNKLIEFDFSVLMHSRLAWNEDICQKNNVRSKNNDWVIYSFKELVNRRPDLNAQMIILEYGPDIDNTKKLISQLDLEKNISWIQKTSRKNLMWLLRKVSIGVGEFIESPRTMWGGTGWEVLASGKPLLQGFLFDDGEFEDQFGFPEPPILKVKSQSDITKHLLDLADNPIKASKIGIAANKWFNTYNGKNLAKNWLTLLRDR
jgi:hypothetical protein